jgi:hypothetical protein
MKTLFALFLLTAGVALAQTPATFPGLKTVMTPEEFARAGLSGLTPEQLALIDAAIVNHYNRTVTTAASQQAAVIVQQQTVETNKRSWLARFGMPDLGADWKDIPSLKAHCTGWVGGNGFKLDNGQVWEGEEQITNELADHDIEIQARPAGNFALYVDGVNTTILVHRIK